MKNLKSILCMILVLVIGMSVISGCQSKDVANTEDTPTISWWIKNSTGGVVSNYSEIQGFQELAKMSNVNLEFIHPISGQESAQFNIMMASGDYPDVISYNWSTYQGGEGRAVQDKVLVSLNDYVNKDYMPNYWAFVEQEEVRRKRLYSSDGNINLLYGFNDTTKPNMYIGPVIRKDWLDKLGLEVPETIDEWYTVLKAFKEQDPNGNGIADEIPFTDDTASCWRFFAGAWGASSSVQFDKNGTPIYSPKTEDYRDFLTTMKKWYEEELIDNEYAAQSRDTMNYKMTTDIAGSFIGYSGSQMGSCITVRGNDGTGYEVVAAPWPKLTKDSPAYIGYIESASGNTGNGITTANKNIEATLRFFDNAYSKKGIELVNYGIEGVSFERDGDTYKFTDAIMHDPEGKEPTKALAPYAIPIWPATGMVVARNAYDLISRSFVEQQQAAEIWLGDDSLHLPRIMYTEEETTRRADIFGDLNLRVFEYASKVLDGTDSIDNWDKYVADLERMGATELETITREAYDRYMAN